VNPLQTSPTLSDEQALRQILDVTRQLAAPIDLATMLQHVMTAAKAVLSADRGSVFLYDEANRELYTTIADGTRGIRIGIDKGIAGECARTRTIINVPDCYSDPRFNQEVDRRTGYRTNNLITVPLIGLEDKLVGVMQLLNAAKGLFDARDERIADALASQAAVAIQRSMLMEEREIKLKLERDLSLAREIQEGCLPDRIPTFAGYELATYSKPADETGGDIFDLIPTPMIPGKPAETLHIMLADATGHGIGPALSVTQARSMFRLGLRLGSKLDDLVTQINAQLCDDLSSRRFITAFMGRLEPANHRVMYQSAGQGPLVHIRATDGQADARAASTIPLGVVDDIPLEEPGVIEMAPGDLFVLLTDGFYEAQNPQGKQMGTELICEYLASVRHLPAQQIMDGMVQALAEFTDGAPQLDDLTGVIIKRV
jgi:sigma-B regulation protein RsbU (phosphoserine phosphatase)